MRKFGLVLIAICFSLVAYADAPSKAPANPPALAPTKQPPVPGQPTVPSLDQTPDETIPETPTYEYALGKMLLTLLGLIVLIILTVWMLKKLGSGKAGSASGQSIKILERRPLSQKSVLYLIEVQGKQVLIAESQLEVRRLADIELPPELD
ncbi:MAG: flagellar biosynthetic protein FliO [Chlamydiales bacterium]|nr:flagellar biosynthetic protein FliO [Chlamydiales bacterium]